jgi:peptidyl-prolyl cis-trans isomerase SurA
MRRLLALALLLPVVAGGMSYAQTKAISTTSDGKFVKLDHVVAVINGDVLLESDVQEEMHFAALEPFRLRAGPDTPQDAMRRLINRSLILQQMQEQQQLNVNISDTDAEKSLERLRSHLPQCVKYNCKTDAGWKAFLAASDLTQAEVDAHWKQRLKILRFIDLRFRTGIRISQESIADYYTKTVVPAFKEQGETAPPLSDVSSRIEEVLLQQQVNGLLQDWLKSLRSEGSVRILDPAYSPVTKESGESRQDEEE